MVFPGGECFAPLSPYAIGSAPSIMAGKIAGQDPAKLYIRFGRFFFNNSGLINSFGLALFVDLENIKLLQWIAAGSSRKSI